MQKVFPVASGPYSKGSQPQSIRESEAVTELGVQPPHFSDGATETPIGPLEGHLEESDFLGQEVMTCLRGSMIMRRIWNQIPASQLTDPVAVGTLPKLPILTVLYL